jgi:hypothetical protein
METNFNVCYKNISTLNPQNNVWVSMGLPKNHSLPFTDLRIKSEDESFEVRVRNQELFLRGNFKNTSSLTNTIKIPLIESNSDPETFEFSNWVIDQPEKLLPSFSIFSESGSKFNSEPMPFFDGVGIAPLCYFTLESSNDVRLRFKYRTRIVAANITIDGWIDILHQQDIVPIIVRCSYGTVASEKVLNKRFGSLTMFTGEKPCIDFYRAKGLQETFYNTQILKWETQIVSPRLWWKARTIEVFGALLCLPDYSELGKHALAPNFDSRLKTLRAREEGPVVAFADVFNFKWLAAGAVPNKSQVSENFLYTRLINVLRNSGDEYNLRDYAQPPNSNQTGNQPDFGVSRGELVVSQKLAFMLHHYRFSVQAWMLRPYSHKEVNGDPVIKANHPNTLLWDLRVDTRFGSDFLGFPNPIPYHEFWSGSDNQHRSDNLLYAMYALTRDPSIKATIDDLVQCSLMELKTYRLYGMPTSIESPRGWGRPLLSMAHAVSLGFEELRPNLEEMVDVMYNCAALRKLPSDSQNTVRTLSRNGSKYGWTDSLGRPIQSWVCWEESIAVIGLWAAFQATGNTKARDLALDVAATITRHAFFKWQNSWYACYAVRFNTSPGVPISSSSYRITPVPEDNKDVYVYNMAPWMIAPVKLISQQSKDSTLVTRAEEILSFFKNLNSPDDAAWQAL